MMTIDSILDCVAHHCRVKRKRMLSKERTAHVAMARHIACYMVWVVRPDLSLAEIGRTFGRHHTTVMNSIARAQEVMADNPAVRVLVDTIHDELVPRPAPPPVLTIAPTGGWFVPLVA